MSIFGRRDNVITYTVNKAVNTNMYITVQNGEVVVNAPWYFTSNKIQQMVQEKKNWILSKMQEYEENLPVAAVSTGGTTGFPKTAVFDNESIIKATFQCKLTGIFPEEARWYDIMPPSIAYGLADGSILPFSLGNEVKLNPDPTAMSLKHKNQFHFHTYLLLKSLLVMVLLHFLLLVSCFCNFSNLAIISSLTSGLHLCKNGPKVVNISSAVS